MRAREISCYLIEAKKLELIQQEDALTKIRRNMDLYEERVPLLQNLLQQSSELLSIEDVHATAEKEQEAASIIHDGLIDQQLAV
jgi:hypothetical protein